MLDRAAAKAILQEQALQGETFAILAAGAGWPSKLWPVDRFAAVASYLGNVVAADDAGSGFPGWVGGSWERAAALRYGENPHQRAALYVSHGGAPRSRGQAFETCTAARRSMICTTALVSMSARPAASAACW